MDMNIIDIVLVVSLGILALSTIIFLSFFIPVLVQLKKVLESLKLLMDLVNDYIEGIHNKIHSVGDNVSKVMNYVSSLGSAVFNRLLDLVSFKK